MHTLEVGGFNFIHNSDLSGDVLIVQKGTGKELEVPGSAILEFVAEHIRMKKITALEQASIEEILE